VRLGSICGHNSLPKPTPPPLRGPPPRSGEDLAADDPAGNFTPVGDKEGLDHSAITFRQEVADQPAIFAGVTIVARRNEISLAVVATLHHGNNVI
jgi:hypothetical protein